MRYPTRSTRSYTLFPYPTLVRSAAIRPAIAHAHGRSTHCRNRVKLTTANNASITGLPSHAACNPGPCASAATAPVLIAVRLSQVSAKRQNRLPPSRSEEHTSELQSLMRISYAVFCLKNKNEIGIPIEAHT